MRRALWSRRLALKQSSSLLGFDFVVGMYWLSFHMFDHQMVACGSGPTLPSANAAAGNSSRV